MLVLLTGVNSVKHKLGAAAIGGALLMSNIITATAQQTIGTTGIGGTVNPALKLSISREWSGAAIASGVRAGVESETGNATQIALSGNGANLPAQIVVPMEIRTNIAYELRIASIGSSGCAPAIATSIGSTMPSGRLVRPAAVNASLMAPQAVLASDRTSARLISGPRVSLAGDYSSLNNALIVSLVLNIQPGSSCAWRTTLLISLTPAGQ